MVLISGVNEKYKLLLINIQAEIGLTGKCYSRTSCISSHCQQKPFMSYSVAQCLHLCEGGYES